MPIYEYQCQVCKAVSSFLILHRKEPFTPVCKRCGASNLSRVLSRVNVRLSEETRLERLADPARLGGLDENNPQSMARFMKDMAAATGEDLGAEEIDQMMEEAAGAGNGMGAEDMAGDDF
ncbi:FmdB family zinc ribbon protein [Desulfobacca acetoxidans]|uniref:Regulatory protein, FmdB family n=1 Tax=Desulfobacca acetoxidans (strain ATCC 700848 / DSM 11109 / ASRB2) TaxID=880072 RepID=F2NHP4_DESAR|nr:FmdB family zinc ribbon protein [Desulfobacca acetoxidans]AEB09231.1 regulatory protein, FmdB family [Desulfobacca acetoxidans DSM 11109]